MKDQESAMRPYDGKGGKWTPLEAALFCLLAALLSAPHTAAQGGSWQTLADLPTPRRLLSAALHGGEIYTFGGCGSPCYDPTLHPQAFEETRVEVFDPATGSWSVRAPMPTIFFSGAATALGGHVYLAGGSVTANVLQRYHPASDSWTLRASMPTPRFGLALVALDGKLFALGGDGPSGALEVYDPGGNSWSSRAPMPTPRVFLAAAAVGGKIYAAGGSPDCCGHSQTNVLEIYDPRTDTWTTGPPLPAAQQGSAAADVGGWFHVFGGFVPGSGTRDQVFVFDPRTATWSAGAAMPTARDQAPAASDGCSAFVPGGSVDCHCQALDAFERFTAGGRADLEITKTSDAGGTVGCGDDRVEYSIMVRNLGPDRVAGARVRDVFPAALGLPPLDETVDLDPGESITFTAGGTVAAGAAGELCNTATVEAPACVTDPDPSNNASTVCDTIVRSADLAITKSNGVEEVPGCTGEVVTYAITVENLGPCPVTGARVTDEFPPELDLPALDQGVDLAAGEMTTIEVGGVLDPAACGSLTNTATVEPPAGVTDPDPSNNSATDSDPILREADLAITKTNHVDEVFVCEEVTYELTVTNNSSVCPAEDASLSDTFPPELGLPPLVLPITLAAGESMVVTSTGVLEPAASGTLANTAWIDPPATCATDPDGSNNHDSDDDPIRKRNGDPQITKVCTPAEVFASSGVDCTLVASNPGPHDVFGVTVADDFPDQLIDVTWTCTPTGGATCTPAGGGDLGDVIDLPVGSAATYVASATVGAKARDEICNTACLEPPEPLCFDDEDPANNCATACVLVVEDCNDNHVDDAADIANGTSEDVNGDGIPDECQIGNADWAFIGTAEGGTVVVTIEGVPGLFADCVVVTPTVMGESAETVAANNLAAIEADVCLAPRELTGMVMGASVWLKGFLLYQRQVSIEITDPGLDVELSAVKIPIVSSLGLAMLALLLAAAGAFRLARRRTFAQPD